jgi:hypothetical protein
VSEESFDSGPGREAGDSVAAALSRARRHARNSVSEGILAVRALLDAVSLLQGVPAESNRALERVAHWLERLAAGIAPDAASDAALTRALAEALDAEIARWEQRAQDDGDARAVLRAFLGLRELLWELGVRPTSAREDAKEAPVVGRRGNSRKRRVQRVPVRADPSDALG